MHTQFIEILPFYNIYEIKLSLLSSEINMGIAVRMSSRKSSYQFARNMIIFSFPKLLKAYGSLSQVVLSLAIISGLSGLLLPILLSVHKTSFCFLILQHQECPEQKLQPLHFHPPLNFQFLLKYHKLCIFLPWWSSRQCTRMLA